jgi:hypothetical protein
VVGAGLQVLGGNLYFLLVSAFHAVAAVGLLRQMRGSSRWGVSAAAWCARYNGCVNLLCIAGSAIALGSGSARPGSPTFLISNLLWLAINTGRAVSCSWSGDTKRSTECKSLGIF